MNFKFLIPLLTVFLFSGCQTPPLHAGVQSGFEAINPASIIAVPTFTLANPSRPASVDHALLSSERIVPQIEDKVISSFNGQPNINGYPFSVVAKAMGTAKPNLLDQLNSSMRVVSNRFLSRDVKTRVLITPQCFARRNFLEFYSYCLASDPDWLAALNALAARVLNADSALFVIVNDLQTHVENHQYQITGSVAVLLVDTNNGKLIWGNDKSVTLKNPPEKAYFPNWTTLIDKIFTPDFWNEFPGRVSEAHQTSYVTPGTRREKRRVHYAGGGTQAMNNDVNGVMQEVYHV